MGFSERYGYKPARLELQVDHLDEQTIVGLWNVTWGLLLEPYCHQRNVAPDVEQSLKRVWMHTLKLRLDKFPFYIAEVVQAIEAGFFQVAWHEVLGLIEDLARAWPHEERRQLFQKTINVVLEDHLVAYRFVGDEIVRVNEAEQVTAVEAAQEAAAAVPAARKHLDNAITLLNNLKEPNYAKSISESVSSVEAVAREVTGNPKATLGDALKKLPDLHPALRDAWSKLYGFTSDSGGIRHAATADGQPIDQSLAIYFLVTCSAFVSYLLSEVQP